MKINNNINMNGLNHFEYEDENEITNSKDEQLNNDDLNNKVDINYDYNYSNIRKAIKPNINNLSLSSKIKKEKRNELKNNNLNLNKIQSNPFLIQNSFPTNNNQKKKPKNLATSVYFIKLKAITKNSNSLVKSMNLVGKSIFTKISENLLENDKKSEKSNKNIKCLEQINEDNYNQLTEELYLHSKVINPTNENDKIISEFLKRKKREEILKKIHMENDDSHDMLQTLKDLKRAKTLTDRNRRYKSTRTFFEFLQDQKDKEEKHQFLLKKNEFMQKEKINLNYREKPMLNKESIKIINKSIRDKMNIHMKLYQDFNEKKKREEEKEKEKEKLTHKKNSIEIKISKKKIEENSKRLYNEYKIKKDKNEEIKNKIKNEIKNMNFNSVSKNSKDIIYKKLIKKIKSSIIDLFGKKIEDEFDINYDEFLKLLYNIGFISNNYFDLRVKNNIIDHNNKIKNYLDSEIEYKLSKEAWKIIVNNKEFINDNNIKGNSKKVMFFILSTIGLYDEGNDNEYIKNKLQKNKIEINPDNINLSLSSQIYKSFHLYRNCAINFLFSREEKNKNNTIIIENEKSEQEKAEKKNIHKNKFINNKANIKSSIELFKTKQLKQIETNKDSHENNTDSFIPIPNFGHNKKNEKVKTYKNTNNFFDKSFSMANNDYKDINNKNDYNLVNNSFNSNNLMKMFLNNPLENDDDIQKKIKGLKEARNKRKIDKIIKEKGIRIKDIDNNNLYDYNYDYSQRFVYTDEPLNNFKNTFKKYEKSSLKQKLMKKEKYIFEIFVERQPKKLIIYKSDDINLKIKEFCSKYNLDYNDKKQIIENIYQQIKVVK